MSELVRISISLEAELASRLDQLVSRAGFDNRSEYIRQLVRTELVDEQWTSGKEVLGTITLIYDHHQAGLSDKLNELQHEYHANVLASTHVHLDHGTCAEMIMTRGKPEVLRALTDGMRRLKGVLHATLSVSAGGGTLKGHRHAHT
jgi:CopG family nickel-responsive transcriptional regulator